MPLGFVQAWRLVGKHKPNVVLGVGGYSSGPVLVAARLRGVPTIIHEANAFPGLANRVRRALRDRGRRRIRRSTTASQAPDGVVTGNPIRQEFFEREASTANQQAAISNAS